LTHIVLLRSHDNGRTFDAPVPLSTDGDDIYVPWIGGDDAGGFHVMWDERTTGNQNPWSVRYVHAPSGAPPSAPVTLSTGFYTNDTDQREIGDFNGVATLNDLPILAWGETTPDGGGSVTRGAFGVSCP
jgi:hypothetical protein